MSIAIKDARSAIIGCGGAAELALIKSLRRISWLPSVSIDGSSPLVGDISRGLSRKVKARKIKSWQSVKCKFDAALVTLPLSVRGSTGSSLADAGKHVLMETPIAATRNECRAMIAAADRSRVILSAQLPRRYLRIARWTKALLQSETLGEIRRFDVREGIAPSSDVHSGLTSPPRPSDGGVLVDIGAHTLDLVLWWLGDFDSVDYSDDGEGGVAADCTLECRLRSGANGRIEFSRTRHLRNTIRIEGTRGEVEVHLYKNLILAGSPNALAFGHDGVNAQELKPQLAAELLDAELKDFRTSVSSGGQVGIAGRESANSVELIDLCYAQRRRLAQPWDTAVSTIPLEADVALPRLPQGSKVLVTGAGGFVGGRLVERLVLEQGALVRGTIRDAERAARVGRLPVELVSLDLCNSDEVDRAVDGVDYVFHCAYDGRSRRQNIDGLRHLIDACTAHSVRRLIHVSTFAVYEPFPDGPLSEATRDGDRSNVYVDTKLDLEKTIFEAIRDRGLAATIIQPAIVYGPFCRPWTNTPAEMLIFGDVILPDRGEGLCNAVYIDDLVDSLVLAATLPAAVGERFIISGPRPVTWAAFFTEMARAVGTNPPKFWPHEEIAKANHGAIRNSRGSIANPKRLIKVALRSNPMRRVLQSGLNALPGRLRMKLMKHYFGSGGRRTGETFLPSQQALALYSSKAIADSAKARSKLGYRPCFDFQPGMALTGRYLEWAYGDICQLAVTRRSAAPLEKVLEIPEPKKAG
jgi:nucleoside-diphosphate-sugar epimerase/predicted dehydrogenase